MGYKLRIVLDNHVADPTETLYEVIDKEADLLDEILEELARQITLNGHKGILAIIIRKDDKKTMCDNCSCREARDHNTCDPCLGGE